MLKGVVQTLGHLDTSKYINLFGLWAVNTSLIYIFVFRYKYKLKGIWFAKLCTDVFYFVSYYSMCYKESWQSRIQRMKDEAEEQQRMIIRSDGEEDMYFEKGYRTDRTNHSNPNLPAGPASVPPRSSLAQQVS